MEKIICGECALKAELNLSTRIHLANSRKLEVEYICPDCGKIHCWSLKSGEEEAPEQPPEILETAEIPEIRAAEEIYTQMRLF